MKTCKEIRYDNLLLLIEKFGSIQKLADALDKSHGQISQLKNKAKDSKTGNARSIGDDQARDIELKLGLEVGWMDHERDPNAASLSAGLSKKFLHPTTQKVVDLMEAMDDETRGAVYGAALMLVKALPQKTQQRILKAS